MANELIINSLAGNGMEKNATRENRRAKASALRRFSFLGLVLFCLLAATGNLRADDDRQKIFAQRAETAFNSAQAQYEKDTNNPVAAWKYASACFDWADMGTNKSERAAIAKDGIAACHRSLLFTNSCAGHYYLALNMGELAETETMGALKLVREMEREFQTAADLDAQFDFAGANRGLGLLYRDAPGWPVSIGSRQKARENLKKAAALAPDYPDNVMNLAESYAKWGDHADAKKELDLLDALWPKAQKSLAGEAWEQNWDDWSTRRDALREKLGKK